MVIACGDNGAAASGGGSTSAGGTMETGVGDTAATADSTAGGVDLGGDVLALETAQGIAVDATHVYYAAYLGGAVRRVPKVGGAAVDVATGLEGPTWVARVEDSLFVLDDRDAGDAALVRFGLDSGDTESIDATADTCCLRADATSVYWVHRSPDGDSLMRMVAGSPAVDVMPWGAGQILAAHQGTVYAFFDGNELREIDATMGIETPLAAASDVRSAVVDGDDLYTLSDTEGTISLSRVALADGSVEPLATVAGLLPSYSLAVDATHLFFMAATIDTSGGVVDTRYGALWAIDKENGETTVLTDRQPTPMDLAIDDNDVFFTDFGTSGEVDDPTRQGRVMRIAKTGV